MISVYADGSSSGGSNKPGGYGFVIVRRTDPPEHDEIIAWSYGGSPATTNNLMELEGAIAGLEVLIELGLHKSAELAELVCDSQYVLGVASGGYDIVANPVEANRVKELAAKAGVRFRWVRGHKGEPHNEICDKLAKQGKLENTPPELLAKQAAKRKKKAAPGI